MEPRKLLASLMAEAGLNPNRLASLLQNRTTQPQIYKYLNAIAREPKRSTLQPVADYFQVPVEAFYDPDLAEAVMRDRSFLKGEPGEQPRHGNVVVVTSTLSHEDARLLDDFHTLMEDDQIEFAKQIADRAAKMRAHNAKVLQRASAGNVSDVRQDDIELAPHERFTPEDETYMPQIGPQAPARAAPKSRSKKG